MRKINYYIANSSGAFDRYAETIEDVFTQVEKYAVPKLKIKHAIDVIVTDAFCDITPETHIGGHTYKSDFVTITIDTSAKEIGSADLFQVICHELCHAVRWQYNPEYMKTLREGMLFEGLATAFELEAAADNNLEVEFFAKTMRDSNDLKNKKILSLLESELENPNYDYQKIFFNGDMKMELPRWAGYSLGYYFVKKYLDKYHKKASDIFDIKYDELK